MDDFEVIPVDGPIWCKCMSCNWEGPIDDCGFCIESAGWEYPPYKVATCPECEEDVEY